MKRFVWSFLLAMGVALPTFAQGVSGVVTTYVDLYAGPDAGYPTIAQVAPGTPVAIQGCIEGWGWCDVITMGIRGWVPGTYVQYTYQSQPVYVADYGARIGIPIVAFSIGLYWGNYYRDRPFYRNRDYWYHRPYAPRPPPRPPGWHPGYRPPPPGHRPPPPDHRPPPPSGHRPPPGNNRPPPPPGNNRPPPGHGGNRPPPSGGSHPQPQPGGGHPPSHGGPPPGQGHGAPGHGGSPPPKPQTRPAPQHKGDDKH